MTATLQSEIEAVAGARTVEITQLDGGCIGQVFRVRLEDGSSLVAKVDERKQPSLDVEAYMLRFLSQHSPLPVPHVLHSSKRLLLMALAPGRSAFDDAAQRNAAELLAAAHAVSAKAFGFERDTLIGDIPLPNGWMEQWIPFFRERRLVYIARKAREIGRLSHRNFDRLLKLGSKLNTWLEEPEKASLIHGDVWTTNVLARDGRITAFLDPAIYFAHFEMELAYISLFDTFGRPFFERYQEFRPIPAGFFDVRRDLYNLFPLLVHAYYFGGGYEGAVERTLQAYGC